MFLSFLLNITGFHMLTHDLRYGVMWSVKERKSRERLYVALQQMFPTSPNEKIDEVKVVTESYHKYKQEYVKHLCFDLDNENLSKCF